MGRVVRPNRFRWPAPTTHGAHSRVSCQIRYTCHVPYVKEVTCCSYRRQVETTNTCNFSIDLFQDDDVTWCYIIIYCIHSSDSWDGFLRQCCVCCACTFACMIFCASDLAKSCICSSALLLACGMCLFDLLCTLLYFHHFVLLSGPTSSSCNALDVTRLCKSSLSRFLHRDMGWQDLVRVVQLLVDHKADVDAQDSDEDGHTVMIQARFHRSCSN